MAVQDWTEPNVCLDENLTTDEAGLPQIEPFAVARLVADVKGLSGADGVMFPEESLPGKKLIDIKASWRNDTPLEQMVIIRVTRGPKHIIVSNPNAIQFRDRITHVIDTENITPEIPVTTGIYDSQCGGAADLGTNSVAEPNPGKMWLWWPTSCMDRWVGPVRPGEKLSTWYQCYVWTPPPFSDNANKNSPQHEAYARWSRVSLIVMPQQGRLVIG